MMFSGFLTAALALAGAFLFGYDGAPLAVPFITWVVFCGAVLLFKERAHE